MPPQLVIADGALGFWKAAGEVWPKTREQRCCVRKTANVIAKLPKSQQPKRALQEIWMAETKAAAEHEIRSAGISTFTTHSSLDDMTPDQAYSAAPRGGLATAELHLSTRRFCSDTGTSSLFAAEKYVTGDYLSRNTLTRVSRHVTKLLVGPDKKRIRLSAYWESLDVFKDAICCVGVHVS